MSDFEDNRAKARSTLVNATSTIILVAFFAIAALVLLSAGMQVYQKVVLAANENFELRTSISYVATKIRQSDVSGDIAIKEIYGRDVLVMSQEIDGDIYDTMIFFKDGVLYELMQGQTDEPDLDFAFETLEIDSFSMEQNGNAITLTAGNASGDSETLTVYLKSRQ